jgi:FAD synthase
MEKIRDEIKFENINALIEQIKKDVVYATRYFEK